MALKILVIRVGRAGDMMMITPALRALLDRYPNAEFHMLTSPDGQRVLKHYAAQLTRFLIYQRSAWLAGWHRRRLRSDIARGGYDRVFCFELKPSFTGLYADLPLQADAIDMSHPGAHYARRCLDVVSRATGDRYQDCWLNLPVTAPGRARALATLGEQGIGPETFVIGLHPTYSGMKKAPWRRHLADAKLWPPEHFAALARLLADYGAQRDLKLRIIMDLIPEERAIGEAIARLSNGQVTLMVPPPDFQRYVATLERMDLLVTPDTGPMHIAAAVGTRFAALFGGTRPEDCGPYVPDTQFRILQPPSGVQGIAAISPAQVFAACVALMAPDQQ
jgi:ADP-heptose:LPS heptosyltransferase